MRRVTGTVLAAGLLWAALVPAAALAKDLGEGRFGGRTDHADGTSTVTFGQRLTLPWETRFGLDLAVANDPDRWELPGKQRQTLSGSPSADAAWARVVLPGLVWDRTEVEARVIPFEEQARLGTKFSRRVAVGKRLAMTMETGYAVTRRLAAEHPTGEEHGSPHMLEAQASLGLDILPTATKVTVGHVYSSTEHAWLRTISAEQKLFGGPLSVSGSVSETATGEVARTISAAFRRKF